MENKPGNGGEEKIDPGQLSPEDKKKAFEANPDDFVDINTLVVAIARTPKGLATLVNPATENEYHAARSRADFAIAQQLMFMAAHRFKAQQENNKIITDLQNKRGFRNFIKGGKN